MTIPRRGMCTTLEKENGLVATGLVREISICGYFKAGGRVIWNVGA